MWQVTSTGVSPYFAPLPYHLAGTSAPPAPPATPLAPNEQGYVRVQTQSGSIRCSIAEQLVACQTSTDNWFRHSDGRRFHTISLNADGDLQWVSADLGELAGRITLECQTYAAQGWTIAATAVDITFTNGRSGRGMSVSDEDVQPF
jgi:hypothetical protein